MQNFTAEGIRHALKQARAQGSITNETLEPVYCALSDAAKELEEWAHDHPYELTVGLTRKRAVMLDALADLFDHEEL